MNLNDMPTTNPYASSRQMSIAKNGMVATSQPLAAQAGLDILKRGGNAVDAAIATAACLTVVEPTSNGIGSDAFAIVWMDGTMHGLNSSGKSPESISIEKITGLGHKEMPKHGLIPITVPGTPGAWAALNKKFGKLSLTDCLKPAVDYARSGFPLSPVVAKSWARATQAYKRLYTTEEFTPWFDTFAPTKQRIHAGTMMTLKHHADTLEAIGKTNAEDFYSGGLAKQITDFIGQHGGFLTMNDLAAFNPSWVQPVSVNYRGYDVWEIPPNGQGIVALIALNILKGFEFASRDDLNTLHYQFEAMKLAFIAGKEAITDPEHMSIPIDALLSDHYADYLRKKITDQADAAVPYLPPTSGTVYLCTADGDGNMVSYIQSNYMGFGSGIVIPGTGIAMQNRGADFSLDPNHANALKGNKKTYHTIIPGFLSKNNMPIGPFGVMGGYMQPQGHLQMMMNSIDFNLNPQSSLDAPRWQWLSEKRFEVETDFPKHLAQGLIDKGHKVISQLESGSFGRGQMIWRSQETGVLFGGTEKRCDGHIAHY